MAKPPEPLQFKRDDFPSTGLSKAEDLDALFLPLNRYLDDARMCLSRGVGINDNCAFEVRTVRVVAPSTDWVTAALTNSWVDAAIGGEVPGYRKDALGGTWLRGQVKNGTLTAAAFTMAATYAPPALKIFPAMADNAGTPTLGKLQVSSAGAVTPQTGATTFFSLDSIHFVASDRTPVALSCFPVDLQLQRVSAPLGVALLGVRDVTAAQNGGGADGVLALGSLKHTMLSSTKVRIQNLPGLLLGRAYDLVVCAFT